MGARRSATPEDIDPFSKSTHSLPLGVGDNVVVSLRDTFASRRDAKFD